MFSEIYTKGETYIGRTIDRHPVVWERGEGCWLIDAGGTRYLDFFSGHGVMCLGHQHPAQLSAMQQQLDALVHAGNHYYLEKQVLLAEKLVESSFADKVLFANSGGEIVDLSIKLARKWAALHKGEHCSEILTMEGSFHGRSYGALSATNQGKFSRGMGPMLPGFTAVAFNSIRDIDAHVTDATCAILLEPVLGEGGIVPADSEYMAALRERATRHNILLIFEEIQCGLGRLGETYAYEHYGVVPDILLLGKCLGGGLPLSALLTTEEIASCLHIHDHGSTFGGNPVAAAAGIVLLEQIKDAGFLLHIREAGNVLMRELSRLKRKYEGIIREVRGIGLMAGIELVGAHAVPEIHALALQHGLVSSMVARNVLRLLPPYIVTEEEILHAIAILDGIFNTIEPGNVYA